MNASAPVVDGLGGPCPNCGSRRLQAVSTTTSNNFLCDSCGTCSHRGPNAITRVDPLSCPGCASRRVCLAGLAERSP